MRPLVAVIAALAIAFVGAVTFFWIKNGSLESAGAEVGRGVDTAVEKVDTATEPLQKELGDLGDATKESVDRATDGNDRT
jgi:hypothetical protein